MAQTNAELQREQELNDEIDAFLLKCATSYRYFAEHCLFIKTKSKGLQRLQFNKAQEYVDRIADEMMAKHGKVRLIIVKARQQGLSTWIEGRGYWKTSFTPGTNVFILTHEANATKNLLSMAKRYHENCPPEVRPILSKDNRSEMEFKEMGCSYMVGTAKTGDTGRSQTIQFFHGCLAEGTKVLTHEMREKAIEDFNVGDYVITHTGAKAQISYISETVKVCYAVKFKGHSEKVIASGEHKFVTERGKIKLCNLKEGDFVLQPIRDEQKILGPIPFAQPKMVRAQGGGKDEDVPETIITDYNLGRIAGLYLAEGSIKTQYRSQNEPCATVFTVHEREVERTVGWLKELGIYFRSVTIQRRKESKSVNVVANGKSFAMFMEKHFGSKDSKNANSPMFDMDDFARGAIHGYLAGDGHFETKTRRVTAPSIREAITYKFRELLSRLGYGWASINFKKAGFRSGRNERDCWSLRLTGQGVDTLAREMGEETAPRKRKGNYKSTEIVDINGVKFAKVRIDKIDCVGEQPVYDFEVDHEDHSYCLPQCAVSNSEVAYWREAEEISSGAMEGIPEEDDTEVYLESTAKGVGGYFHKVWQLAAYPDEDPGANWNGYIRVFIPWFWEPGYAIPAPEGFERDEDEEKLVELYNLTDDQLAWRRQKIAKMGGDKARFGRDYPATPEEAFNSSSDNILIPADLVQQARLRHRQDYYEPIGEKILGVDVAREGDDSTAFALRQGRVVFWTVKFKNMNSFAVASQIVNAIRKYKIRYINIDSTGGYGAGVYDLLVAWGFGDMVQAVNFAERAVEDERYKNKRAEMWYSVKEWLEEGAQLPDKDEIQTDLCSVTYKFDTTYERLQLESKQEQKKRIKKSPDVGDAIALTFARPGLNIENIRGAGSFSPETILGDEYEY